MSAVNTNSPCTAFIQGDYALKIRKKRKKKKTFYPREFFFQNIVLYGFRFLQLLNVTCRIFALVKNT